MPEFYPTRPFTEKERARFWSKVQKSDGCWLWTGSTKGKGYGSFHTGPKFLLAHRVAWEMTHGAIPNNLQIDHLCRNHACVNPEHMELVDSRTNTLRGTGITARMASKTHCPQGHLMPTDPVERRRGCPICRRDVYPKWRRARDAE
jgi:hypothetical protein